MARKKTLTIPEQIKEIDEQIEALKNKKKELIEAQKDIMMDFIVKNNITMNEIERIVMERED